MKEIDKINTYHPRELHGFRLLGYCFGSFGIMLSLVLVESYVFNFYVYTLRLDSILTSIGSSINWICGAITAILFGVIIDNKKPGKLGKRRPFILYSLPIWIFSIVMIWIPPYKPSQPLPGETTIFDLNLALYYWGINIIRAISGMILMISFSSMAPEISQTLKNRKKIATISSNFQIIGSIISLSFPMILQSFLNDPRQAQHWTQDGQFITRIMPYVGGIFALVSVILILTAFFSVDESFHKKSYKYQKRSLKENIKQMMSPIKDIKFMKYLAASISSIASRVAWGFTVIPFLSYVLLFEGTDFYYYIIISVGTKFVWLFIWKLIQRKHNNLVKTYKLNLVVTAIASISEFVFLMDMSFSLRILLFILSFGTILGCTYSSFLFTGPLMNELIDFAAKSKLLKDTNQQSDPTKKDKIVAQISGSYTGLISFASSIISAISSSIYGIVFRGDNATNPITITLVLGTMSILYIIAYFFLHFLKIELKE